MAQSIGAAAPRVRTAAVRAGSAAGEHQVTDVQMRVCAVLTAAVALTASIGLVVVTGRHPTATTVPPGGAERPVASTSPAGSPVERAAAAWMARSLPHGAAVEAQGDVAGLLRADGFRRVSPRNPGATYLVGPANTGAVAIADFGSGAAAVVVRQRVAARHPAALWAADLAARRPAERELLRNFDVRTTPAARQALAAGDVDMRAATVVALLAGRGPVTVLAAVADPAERAAGLPVRTLDLRVDPGAAQDIRSGLSAAYQPQVVQNLAGGVERWIWPLRALPLTSATP